MHKIELIIYCSLAALLISCDAPRKNPLDPKNPDYKYGRINGSVQTISLPSAPVAHTTISWFSGSEITLSDPLGKFELLLPDPSDGWLCFSHANFHPDSMYIIWPPDRDLQLEVYLNGLPKLDSLFMYSIVLNRYPSFQKEQLIFETYISDRDNDIDSVYAVLNHPSQIYHLPYNTTDKSFGRELGILDLGIMSIEEIVGEPIYFKVNDIFGNTISVGQDQLVRIIHEEVLPLAPINNIITDPSPTLEWSPLDVGYTYHYDLEIYTNELAPAMVWQRQNIESSEVSFTVDIALAEDSYFWVNWAIDEFGNRTRSKPAAFTVQN
jgi:hypothetical protein